MKKISILLLTLICAFSFIGCGYKEGVKNSSPKAYLYFTGATQQAEISVDGEAFESGGKVTADDHYQVQPGKHLVEVKKQGKTVLKRQIYITDGVAKEIQIPSP